MASSIVVAPTTGHGLISTQQGIGATPGFDAIDDRRMWSAGLQEGALNGTAYRVRERAAGANMTVELDANAGSLMVQGDTNVHQGLYLIAPHAGTMSIDATAASATLPRIDSVFARVRDNAHDAGGLNDALITYVAGTATSGATLDNRSGAPALPSSAMRLADILMPANATTVTNTNIRDRRPMAAGNYYRGYTDTNLAGTGGAQKQVPANNSVRLELSGAPVRITMRHGTLFLGSSGVPSYGIRVGPWVDSGVAFTGLMQGTAPPASYIGYWGVFGLGSDARIQNPATHTTVWPAPVAGSHLVEAVYYLDNAAVGGQTLLAPFELIVDELVGRV